ncbi:MAG: hypothetical protein O3C52_06845 [Proteobacteria bacterium]|nr:hypothetical protein [Pseudomonadota bacterium]
MRKLILAAALASAMPFVPLAAQDPLLPVAADTGTGTIMVTMSAPDDAGIAERYLYVAQIETGVGSAATGNTAHDLLSRFDNQRSSCCGFLKHRMRASDALSKFSVLGRAWRFQFAMYQKNSKLNLSGQSSAMSGRDRPR